MSGRTVIFDLDMTLVDSSEARPARDRRNWAQAKQLIPKFSLAAGCEQLLATLSKYEIRYCIVTNSPRPYCEDVIDYFGLQPEFSVCYHDTTNHKPHPDPMLEAVAKLGSELSETICIGDHPDDIMAAKQADLTAISILQLAERENLDYLITQSDQAFFDLIDLTDYLPDCFDFRHPPVDHTVSNHPFLEFRKSLTANENLETVFCLGYRFGECTAEIRAGHPTDGYSAQIYKLKDLPDSANVLDLHVVRSFIWAINYLDLPQPTIVVPILGSGDTQTDDDKKIPKIAQLVGGLTGFQYKPDVLFKLWGYDPLHWRPGDRRPKVEGSASARPLPDETGCVLLIDDIVTSGNTMNEAAHAIKAVNGQNTLVYGAAFAKWVNRLTAAFIPKLEQYNYPTGNFNDLIQDELAAIREGTRRPRAGSIRTIREESDQTEPHDIPVSPEEARQLLFKLRKRIWSETNTRASHDGILRRTLLRQYIELRVSTLDEWHAAVQGKAVDPSHKRYIPEILRITGSIES